MNKLNQLVFCQLFPPQSVYSHLNLFLRQVYDGEYGESFSIGKFCNTNKPPEIWSASNSLVILFHSDSIQTHTGFEASYKFYNGQSLADKINVIEIP